jgi:signal transduction histidine kinase
MADQTRKQLRRATIVFWVLLIYIIAALIWWLISLEQQNHAIHDLKQAEITIKDTTAAAYKKQWMAIEQLRNRNSRKYVLEGITFLLLILFGAVYIYRLVRRQFQVQQQQQNFVMAITHELKTPIAIAKLNLETLQKHKLDEARQQKLMDATIHETGRLDNLINNILISAQLDDDAYSATYEAVNFSEETETLLSQVAARYPDKKIHTDIEEDVFVKGDPLLLRLLVSNLLENANKYAPKGSSITCGLKRINETIQLQVSDEGIGIPDAEKKKIFDKFYRVGNEHIRTTKGTGLGLYICKKIAQAHNGEIRVIDRAPQGSTFTVTFKT